MEENSVLIFRLLAMAILVGFLPVCAYTYFAYRIGQRRLEVERILRVLGITSTYRNIYIQDIGRMHFAVAVLFTMGVAVIGLSALLLSNELGLAKTPSLLLGGPQMSKSDCDSDCLEYYQRGALLSFGLGFLGAYLWGLQGIFRRYSMNDLLPLAFYHFGLRMIMSSIIAMLIYHAVGGFDSVAGDPLQKSTTLTPTADGVLLVTVFLVGMFPQQGLRWLGSKLKLGEQHGHPSVRQLPLRMIEGMTSYDVFRMEELGIDTCYDLSTADFIPLLLKTSYGARELIDWLLQAKLCVRFGDDTEQLRARGIRTIADFEGLDDDYLENLAKETTLTLSALQHASRHTGPDKNIERLKRAAELLSHYWEGDQQNE